MRSRAVSLPRLCWASMRFWAPAEAGLGAAAFEFGDDFFHGGKT